jgi:hypothetical protein
MPTFDTLNLQDDSYIKQFLQVNDEAASASTSGHAASEKMFAAAKNILVDPEPEKVAFSCVIQKINKHGFKQTRYLMIT